MKEEEIKARLTTRTMLMVYVIDRAKEYSVKKVEEVKDPLSKEEVEELAEELICDLTAIIDREVHEVIALIVKDCLMAAFNDPRFQAGIKKAGQR